jgi:purine-binding chemotaxis protein CheW
MKEKQEPGLPARQSTESTVKQNAPSLSILEKLLAKIDSEEDDSQNSIPPEPEDLLEVLVFELNREKYGIPIDPVVEIIRYVEAMEVPHTVHFLEGIISLRGEMIPVLNGRKRLGHEGKTPDKKTRIIILQEKNGHYGITVDSTNQVIRLPKKNIEPAPLVVGLDSGFIEGVCEHRGQIVILLNLNRLLEFV